MPHWLVIVAAVAWVVVSSLVLSLGIGAFIGHGQYPSDDDSEDAR